MFGLCRVTLRVVPLVAFAALLVHGSAGPAVSFSEEWRLENPSVPPVTLRGLAQGAGGVVAVGELGVIAVRSPAGTWRLVHDEPAVWFEDRRSFSLLDVAWGRSRYVAVGGGGAILTSLDGSSWEAVESGTDARLNAVVGTPQGFLAVGFGGTMVWSPNGLDWESRDSGIERRLRDVAWNGEMFLVAGSGGTILSSPDGVSWSAAQEPIDPYAIHWTGSQWLLGGRGRIWASADGFAWMDVTPAEGGSYLAFAGTDGELLAVGSNAEVTDWEAVGRIAHSEDGLSWAVVDVDVELPLYTALGLPGLWLAAGYEGILLAAADPAEDWHSEHLVREALIGVTEWQGAFYAVGSGGRLLSDGGTGQWAVIESGTQATLLGLGAGAGRLVAVGGEGTILVTTDGQTWEAAPAVTSASLRRVAWHDGRFIAVGTEGTVVGSDDGLSWQEVDSPTSESLRDVTWAEGSFVAVGDRRTVLTSGDGLAWEVRHSDPGANPFETFISVTWHEGQFVALEFESGPSSVPRLWASPNGVDWEQLETTAEGPRRFDLRDTASAGEEFVIVGGALRFHQLDWPFPFEPFFLDRSNVALSSSDLLEWNVVQPNAGFRLFGLGAGEGGVVAVGDLGAILRRGGSPPSLPPCEPGPEVLCLQEGRFQVEAAWCDPFGDVGCGQARAVPMTEETGTFWFFNEDNVELMVKVLDGRDFNDRFWVFAGSLSDVVYTLTVTDTATARSETFYNAPGQLRSFKDLGTFVEVAGASGSVGSVAPAGGFSTTGAASLPTPHGGPGLLPAAGCVPGPEHHCLQGGRFRVSVEWCDPFGDQGCGTGKTVPLTADTGSFWFFNEENLELVVKVLDGRAFNNRFWVFWGALSDVEYWITVEDTATGLSQVYYNAPAELASGKDMEAFE